MTPYLRIALALTLLLVAVIVWLTSEREGKPSPAADWKRQYCADARRPNLICDGVRP